MNQFPSKSTRSSDQAKDESSQRSNLSQPPVINLPKGGGAIRGIDEKFRVNPATGSGAMSIPLSFSPGRHGFGPQLSLGYDSGSGSSPFGLGWALSLPHITRKTDKGLPTYQDGDESDVFVLSGAEDLVPVLVEQGPGGTARHRQLRTLDDTEYLVQRYRPRIEGLFSRIERWTDQQTGETHWRTITRDNVTSLYGRTSESQVADPDFPHRIFSWHICESHDDKGNAVLYRYKPENSENVDVSQVHEGNRTALSRSPNRYLKRILYGNRIPHQPGDDLNARTDWMFEVVFDYGEGHLERLADDNEGRHVVEAAIEERQPWATRRDPVSSYRAGFEVRTYRLCQRVLMFHHFPEELSVDSYLVRATHFAYDENSINTVMNSVTQSGYLRQPDGPYEERSLPPVEFEYSRAEIQADVREIDSDSLENLPSGLSGGLHQWVDLDGEGISGFLTEQGSGWFYKPNLGHGVFGPQEIVAAKPSLSALNGGQLLLDLAGDGQLDLVSLNSPVPGFYERTHDHSWSNHRAFDSVPKLDWDDPNVRLVDLTGEGHADILVTNDHVLTWYPSLAEAGYGPGTRMPQAVDDESGPRIVFADPTQSIYLADMSGDGLADLVRVRNGSVCYWPNLGYGRFGAKVTMDNAPWLDLPDQFDQRRIRLADVDGSGITDILYVHQDRVAVYFNEAGNSWAEAQFIEHVPAVDNLSEVNVTDLLGNGTACLLWSSPLPGNVGRQMRYVDLMGGQKPHLMIASRNNLGAETRVRYAASTQFYLEDKAAGRVWITRLPFPVHVVERIETHDHISRNRFVTRYSYHHGYYDGEEREFRGFGLVEQVDTAELAALNANDSFPAAANVDAASHIPPVLTRTWSHPGAYLQGQRISRLFAADYYRQPGITDEQFEAQLLPDTVMPAGLTPQEEREAARSLKGVVLRQEVYALDGSTRSVHPYTVTEHNFTIETIQPAGPNRNAVFFTHERETISYNYERNPADPRVSHACVLATDAFGNVRQSMAVGYGRRQPDPALSADDQNRQRGILVTYAENDYTNAIELDDAYRTPLLSESRSYEVSGLDLPSEQTCFDFEQLRQAAGDADEIQYHETPTPGALQRRVLEQVRTFYRRNDLAGSLPLGDLESLALPFESYQLALAPEHIELVFGGRVTEALLTGDGHYVHAPSAGEAEANWWSPSGRVFLSPDAGDDAAEELAFAQQHFFLPWRFVDPFGQATTVDYDGHGLLMVQSTDALANRVTAHYDYRLLAPDVVTTPNRNRSAVAFDVLGMVTGAADMGKETEELGDSLENFQAQPTQAQIDAFFADPRGPMAAELLAGATSRILYDEGRFHRLGEPAFAATVARETHSSALEAGETSVIQVSMAYSDGFGRTIQGKVQAEAGSVGEVATDVGPRWTTTGWTIFNNKGNPVRQYEPFFSATHTFEFGVTVGVSSTLFYDPLGRVVAALHPHHTWEKVNFDPWRQESWDVNDTVLDADPAEDPDVGDYFARLPTEEYLPTWHQARIDGGAGNDEMDAAQKAAAHAETPTVIYFDSLGRPFLSLADNGPDGRYATRTEQDIEGNSLRIIDDRGNVVMAYQIQIGEDQIVPGHDAAGRQLFMASMDAGESRALPDAGGKTIRSWDSRGQSLRATFDELQRPTHLFVQRGDEPEVLAERTIYGETVPAAESLNLRGQTYRVYDGAGVVTSQRLDFRGNLLESSRQLAREYRTTVDWSALAEVADIAALEAIAAPMLDSEIFTTQTAYDALNRPVAISTPDNSVTLPTYSEASLLDQMAVRLRGAVESTPFVSNIDYNARGQREQITYATEDGANFTTTYQYNPDTFQLTGLQTVRHRDGAVLQDLRYAYDPAGNITSIRDEAQQTVYFNNVEVEPHQSYTYDALYRLTRAEGREHATQNNVQREATAFAPLVGIPHPNSPEALQPYVESYAYDSVGNMTRVRHIGGAIDRWTRRYQVAENSNRLLGTSLPGDAEDVFSATFDYDAHGNMIRMPHLPLMRWDVKDQLQATSSQVVEDGTPEITYYVYNSEGERVRKVTERQAPTNESPGTTSPTRRSERLYLGGTEIYREYAGDGTSITLQRETLHVMDDQQRVALVETRTQGSDDSPAQVVRYQLSNHLGSATVEIDATAALISYEEYYPYGATAYCAGRSAAEVSLKRYRYAAKEQDEETSLHYYGARYYASWLGRWTTVDPAGITEGTNLYQYVSDNPVRMGDPSGMAEEDTTKVRVHSGPGKDALVADLEEFERETKAYKKARADYNLEYSFYLGAGRYQQQPERRAHLDAHYYYYYSALNRWARDLQAQGRALSVRVDEARRLAPFFQSMRTAETVITWWAAADLAIITLGAAALTFSVEQVSAYAYVTAWRAEGALSAVTASSPFLVRLAANPRAQVIGAASAAIVEADSLAQGSSVPGSTPSVPGSAPVTESTRAIGTKKLGQRGMYRTVERGTEQLMLNFEPQTVFSGHGVWHKKVSGFIRVPPGTTLTVYVKKGELMGDRLGQAIELNVDLGAVYKKVYKPGQLVPNLTLYPAGRLSLMGKPVTVQQPTLLKDLLKPNMGSCHWAACFKIDRQ